MSSPSYRCLLALSEVIYGKRATYAAHAFVDKFGLDSFAVKLDGRHTATEGVAVGLCTHHAYPMLVSA